MNQKPNPNIQMKELKRTVGITAVAVIPLLPCLAPAPSRAANIVVNAANSSASITFDDTGVENLNTGNFGVTNFTVQETSWDGSPLNLPLTTDPETGDSAGSGLVALDWPTPSPPLRKLVEITPSVLTQPTSSVGVSTLTILYSVEFQVNHLPSRGSLMPFRLQGNIFDFDSFVAITGEVTFTSASMGWLETLTFDYFNDTPGTFDHFYVPQRTAGGLPSLAGDLLTVEGNLVFSVDPAEVTITQVPEPGPALLLSFGGFALVLRRRR